MERGIISTEHTIWCATGRSFGETPFRAPSTIAHPRGCVQIHQTSAAKPAREAREMGWIYTFAYGWVCPACAVEYQAGKGDTWPERSAAND